MKLSKFLAASILVLLVIPGSQAVAVTPLSFDQTIPTQEGNHSKVSVTGGLFHFMMTIENTQPVHPNSTAITGNWSIYTKRLLGEPRWMESGSFTIPPGMTWQMGHGGFAFLVQYIITIEVDGEEPFKAIGIVIFGYVYFPR